MQWLTFVEAKEQKFRVYGSPRPQTLEITVNLETLMHQIPTTPYRESEGIIPAPSLQWYAWIGKRPIILEHEQQPVPGTESTVCIHTSYLELQNKLGDWTVLEELVSLPSSIAVTRPRYVTSRNDNPEYVVYRFGPTGRKSSVYDASSYYGARRFLEFLRQDAWNRDCFIGLPSERC